MVKRTKKVASFSPLGQLGFTLIELSISLTMGAIVLIAISVIVTGSHKYIKEGTKKINLQRDFSLIEMVLATNIRQSIYGQHKIYNTYSDFVKGKSTKTSGGCLKLIFPSGDWQVFFKDNLDFKIMKSDSTTTNLVPNVVSNLVFTAQTNSIQTDLTLTQDGWNIAGNFIDAFRN